jgi:ribosomal protein S27E
MKSGFEITCLICNKPDGTIAGAERDGQRYIAIRCPHCERLVVKPAGGTEWHELIPAPVAKAN